MLECFEVVPDMPEFPLAARAAFGVLRQCDLALSLRAGMILPQLRTANFEVILLGSRIQPVPGGAVFSTPVIHLPNKFTSRRSFLC